MCVRKAITLFEKPLVMFVHWLVSWFVLTPDIVILNWITIYWIQDQVSDCWEGGRCMQWSNVMWSSKMSRNSLIWILYTADNNFQFLVFSIILSRTKLAISREPYVQFWWCFDQNIALILTRTMKWKTAFSFFSSSDSFCFFASQVTFIY